MISLMKIIYRAYFGIQFGFREKQSTELAAAEVLDRVG